MMNRSIRRLNVLSAIAWRAGIGRLFGTGAQTGRMSYHVGAKEQYQSQSMFTRIRACLLLALISAPGMCGADFAMKVTDKNYLDTQGFSVFLYDSTYHPIFVDQKNTAMRSEERRVGKECRYGWEREQ